MNESKLTYRHINLLLDPYLHIDMEQLPKQNESRTLVEPEM